MKNLKYITIFFALALIVQSCFDDSDDNPQTATQLDIQDFIWKGMNAFYLYKSRVPDLANDRFNSDQEYTSYLNGFNSPEAIFEALTTDDIDSQSNLPIDDFSFLVDDYVALEQAFDGITRNNGMEFGLVRYPNNQSLVFGYVRYVLPNTDAEAKNVQRGMIFNTIDGVQLNDQNFSQLISPDTYTIGLADYNGGDITANGQSIELVKSQYTENPVYLTRTLDVNGTKVGYIMYNAFTGDFDTQLNEAFGQLKADNVTELVLDLRYNGGGSVTSAIDLASMITGQFEGEVFTTEEWNDDRQAAFGDTNLFDSQIRGGAGINSLQLNEIYILTTRSSASASELVISGLLPYITVNRIGTSTRGKFQASVTLYDSDNFGRDGANPGHTYAIQPLVLKSVNSEGLTDYFAGFAPTTELPEDYGNLGTLGDPNEPLLKAALDQISGNRQFSKFNSVELESVGDSNQLNPDYERMYLKDTPEFARTGF